MIMRSVYGKPLETDAVLVKPEAVPFSNAKIENREDGFY